MSGPAVRNMTIVAMIPSAMATDAFGVALPSHGDLRLGPELAKLPGGHAPSLRAYRAARAHAGRKARHGSVASVPLDG